MRGFVLFVFAAVALGLPGRPTTATSPRRLITTIVGTGEAGYSGDGGPGTEGQISAPFGVTVGPDGAIYFCEVDNHCIRRLDLRTHRLSTVAGDRRPGYSGDRGRATDASLNQPYDVRFDHMGNLYLLEFGNNVVRRVDHVTGLITTIAGNGGSSFQGDGGPAWRAHLRQPHSLAFDLQGRLLIADTGNLRIRRIDLKTGIIETMAGTGEAGWTSDGALLPNVPLSGPRALDIDPEGNVYVLLRDAHSVYRIDHKSNRIYRIAGTGERGNSGDGGPATQARLNGPKGLAYADDGSLYIADTENHAIRRVDLKTGIITRVAGTGERGDGPDGDPLHCRLARPHGLDVDRAGNVYICDSENNRVRVLREVLPQPAHSVQHGIPQTHRPAAPVLSQPFRPKSFRP